MESFSMNQGFEAIHYAIAHSTTLCWRIDDDCSSDEMYLEYNMESERLVCDMALWMMRECLVSPDSGHDSIKVGACGVFSIYAEILVSSTNTFELVACKAT